MEPWDEPSSKTFYASRREILQMDKEKAANKFVEEMMNPIKELFQKSAKELSLEDEEMLEGQIYEESHQEDPNEDPDKNFDRSSCFHCIFISFSHSSLVSFHISLCSTCILISCLV
jgi:hypothetical protein